MFQLVEFLEIRHEMAEVGIAQEIPSGRIIEVQRQSALDHLQRLFHVLHTGLRVL
jgi:hypothetical protein